jgi:hypothetical protein
VDQLEDGARATSLLQGLVPAKGPRSGGEADCMQLSGTRAWTGYSRVIPLFALRDLLDRVRCQLGEQRTFRPSQLVYDTCSKQTRPSSMDYRSA